MYKFRRFIVIGFALYLSTFALTSFAQENVKEDEALFVAKRAFEDGFYEVSLGLLERFLKTYPASPKLPEVNLLIGECYFHQSKFLDALSIFEELLNSASSKDIKDAVFYWIAEVHFKGNNFNKASSYYRKIIQEFPKSRYIPSAYYSMGWCLFQESKFAQALEYFKSVEEKYPKVQQAQDASFKIVECLYNLKDIFHQLNNLWIPHPNSLKGFLNILNLLHVPLIFENNNLLSTAQFCSMELQSFP